MAEVKVAKYCMQVEYIKIISSASLGCGQSHTASVSKFCPNHIFGIGETMHSTLHLVH